ncbi:MAG: hypothetical protein ABH810_01905 [bacterium]
MSDLSQNAGCEPAQHLKALNGAMAAMAFVIARYLNDKSIDEAIAIANNTETGDLGSVFRLLDPIIESIIALRGAEAQTAAAQALAEDYGKDYVGPE